MTDHLSYSREGVKTIGDLDLELRALGAGRLADMLRAMKNGVGLYVFHPDDPIDGPYYGDHEAAQTEDQAD